MAVLQVRLTTFSYRLWCVLEFSPFQALIVRNKIFNIEIYSAIFFTSAVWHINKEQEKDKMQANKMRVIRCLTKHIEQLKCCLDW